MAGNFADGRDRHEFVIWGVTICLAVILLAACSPKPESRTIRVDVALVDENNVPVANAPLRVLVGVPDWDAVGWQAPGAGTRVVTDAKGEAHFTTTGMVDTRWSWEPIGQTPFSMPVRVHHVGVGFEAQTVVPSRTGRVVNNWFYAADVSRYSDGTSGTLDVDRIYEIGPGARMRRLGAQIGGVTMGGDAITNAGYHLWNFALDPVGDGAKEWHLTLGIKRPPEPVLR